ncbi:putative metal-dependent HD superfamily phosphohydrolase [Massilia sp. MP_M2]|uniref:HD domain-containing protein n=1 Tax=Massilia sp. MP_M2 TaxID=3071713 RepID=UPI00319DCC4B
MPHQRNVARWLATWAALELTPPTGLCEQLLRAWDEPQRHYHTLQHLGECLALFDTLRAHAEQPADIELALWFHDAVYDVQGHANEARSAHWATEALAAGGVDPVRCQRVHDLIMATCHTALPASPDQALLVDIDLAILGAPAARFAQYTQQINAEYAWVPPEVYAVKRRAVLQGFLDREQIYTTPAARQRLAQHARENLAKAVSSL